MEAGGASDRREEVRAWCATGLLALCGTPDAPATPPHGLIGGLDDLATRLRDAAHSAGAGAELEISWPELVLGRAAMRGFTPKGRTSANGSCRLLDTLDHPVALNLPRTDDLAVLEALIEGPVGEDHWSSLEVWAAGLTAAEVMERTSLLHLAAGALGSQHGRPVITTPISQAVAPRTLQGCKVVDLTSMWAGPLCAHLLARCGASVLKVEARARRDGARLDERFYSWLHSDDQAELLLDLGTPTGRDHLQTLLESADVILESSRPRALRQLGLDPAHLKLRDGVVWAAITARGPMEPMAVGFGDDAAVAGGVVATDATGRAVFCGDAIADPITGMLAAAEVIDAVNAGGGVHLGISMADAAASLLAESSPMEPLALNLVSTDDGGAVEFEGERFEVAAPRIPVGV